VPGGWVRRDGDTTTVGCNDTDETWYLACRDGRWVGNVTGCRPADAGQHTATGISTTADSVKPEFHDGRSFLVASL